MQTQPRETISLKLIKKKVKNTIDTAYLKELFLLMNPGLAGMVDSILKDYLNFITLNAFNIVKGNNDVNQDYSPELMVDLVWKLHTTDIKTYHQDCVDICGELIEYYVDQGKESELDKVERKLNYQRDLLAILKMANFHCDVKKDHCDVMKDDVRNTTKEPIQTTDCYESPEPSCEDSFDDFEDQGSVASEAIKTLKPITRDTRKRKRNYVKIYIERLYGKTLTIDIDLQDTVIYLKMELFGQVCVAADLQTLFFKGEILGDGRTLESCGIQANDTLFVQLPKSKKSLK